MGVIGSFIILFVFIIEVVVNLHVGVQDHEVPLMVLLGFLLAKTL